MLSYLRGTLERKSEKEIELEVAGIGYCVLVPLSTYEKLPGAGNQIKLYITVSTGMYGGETTYYGFLTPEEKELFNLLKSVSKIGTRTALDILSKVSKSLPDFADAIIKKNTDMLIDVFGLTQKTSEKLILGLKSKINEIEFKGEKRIPLKNRQPMLDAIEGLISMGYRESESKEAVDNACRHLNNNATAEEIIKQALRYF